MSGTSDLDRHRVHSSKAAGPIPQLTEEAISPTIADGSRCLSTRVPSTCAHLTNKESTDHSHRCETLRCGAIAELSKGIAAPTVSSATRGLAAGVKHARRHPAEAEPAGHRPREKA